MYIMGYQYATPWLQARLSLATTVWLATLTASCMCTDFLTELIEGNRTSVDICLSSWTPMVYCNASEDQATYTGYQTELWRRTASYLGLTPDNYTFICMDWTPMVEAVSGSMSDIQCDAAAAGMTVDIGSLTSGVRFSQPTYKSGLRILVHNEVRQGSRWAFMNVFSPEVWLALFGTAVAVGILQWFVDGAKARRNTADGMNLELSKEDAAGITFFDAIYRGVGKAVDQPGDLEPFSSSARIVGMAYGLLLLILMELYIANSAAQITAAAMSRQISGLTDLPGKAVGTWNDYVPNLGKYGIAAIGYPWENKADEAAMLDALKSGEIVALVLDDSWVQYQASAHCDLSIIGDMFETFALAFAFPADTSQALVDQISYSLTDKQQFASQFDDVKAEFLNAGANCTVEIYDGGQLHFSEVSGLWIILAGAVAVALLMLLLEKAYWSYRKRLARMPAGSFKRLSKLVSMGSSLARLSRATSSAAVHPADGATSVVVHPLERPSDEGASTPVGQVLGRVLAKVQAINKRLDVLEGKTAAKAAQSPGRHLKFADLISTQQQPSTPP